MPDRTSQAYTIFEYLYRDAGNFKSRGTILLRGKISETERELIESRLESGEFFIAEQVDVKPLYEALYKFSDGMTREDHVWHTFEGFRDVCDEDEIDGIEDCGTTSDFARRFASVVDWNLQLSRHVSLVPSYA